MNDGPQQRLDAAVAALRAGEAARAAGLLRELADELPAERMPWELLADAETASGNAAAALIALDRRLALDMRNIPALLLKGRLLEREGDSRAASSHYQAAINQDAAAGGCPDSMRPLLERGRQFIAASRTSYADHLRAAVGDPPTARAAMALDLLLGRREVYLQQPSVFYFPELPQRQFYDPAEFDWFAPMLELVPEMQAELAACEQGGEGFGAYVTRDPRRPAPNNPLLDDPGWGALWFWRGGERVPENADRCPATMEALSHAPMPAIAGRSPVAHWSRLQPGTHIRPHHGLLNTRLICHIPIRTAPGCILRVGNETRTWADGTPLVFDDSIEHEARNDGPHSRTVLLFEIWRPEIEPEERRMLTRLFETITNYEG